MREVNEAGGSRRGEHEGPRRDPLLGHAVVHVGRREQAEAGVVVLHVDQGKKTWHCACASWIDPQRTRNVGRYFSVLNWASENGFYYFAPTNNARLVTWEFSFVSQGS